MPGKKVGEYAWGYMTPPAVYRVCTDSSGDISGDRDFVEALPFVIEMDQLDMAYNNALNIGIILQGLATNIRIEIYADMGAGDVADAAERWCLWELLTGITESEVHAYQNVPATPIKILVVGVSKGSVVVTESHSA